MKTNETLENLNVYETSPLIERMRFANALGLRFMKEKDLYSVLGYPEQIGEEEYLRRYERQDIAKAIIDRPVNATWRGFLGIVEASEAKNTALEEGWEELEKRLSLRASFIQLDRLTGLSEYGILILGLNDVQVMEDWAFPVKVSGELKLVYVKAFNQKDAKIIEWEEDFNSPRFSRPKIYQVFLNFGGKSFFVNVHYSRVLHVAEGALSGDTYGTPRLECVYNRLVDLGKLSGGSAEMFWQGARPGFQFLVDKDYQVGKLGEDALKKQAEEYEWGLRRMLVNEGGKWEALAMQVADPKSHVDIQIELISSATNIPKRILTGSERGELASTEDKNNWLDYIQSRREEYVEPKIIRPFVEKIQELNLLPKTPGGYDIVWKELYSLSEKDQAEIGLTRARAVQAYTQNPTAEEILPPEAFFEYFLGLSPVQIELIEGIKQDAMRLEEREEGEIV